MAKAIKFAVVALCLICILAICIAPLVDLPATSLRSYQAAIVLLWGLIATAFTLVLSAFEALVFFKTTSVIPIRRKIEGWIDEPIKFSTVLQC
jgi:hypothetical protein